MFWKFEVEAAVTAAAAAAFAPPALKLFVRFTRIGACPVVVITILCLSISLEGGETGVSQADRYTTTASSFSLISEQNVERSFDFEESFELEHVLVRVDALEPTSSADNRSINPLVHAAVHQPPHPAYRLSSSSASLMMYRSLLVSSALYFCQLLRLKIACAF